MIKKNIYKKKMSTLSINVSNENILKPQNCEKKNSGNSLNSNSTAKTFFYQTCLYYN